MSANKKQKIEDGREDSGEIPSIKDLLAKHLGQHVERSVKDLLAHQQQELVRTQQALKQNQKALYAAMQIVNDTFEVRCNWGTLSADIRNDPNCVIQAIQGAEKIRLQPSDIPRKLLRNNRHVALEACKAGLYNEFIPTPDEWRNNEALSRVALEKGLIENMADVPLLTPQAVVDLLWNKKMIWENIPQDLKADENFCRRVVTFQDHPHYGRRPLAPRVFRDCPSLRQDRQVWEEIMSSENLFSTIVSRLSGLRDLLTSELPPLLCADFTFMQRACEKVPSALQAADPIRLEQFIQNKIIENPQNLAFCPPEFPILSPEFVQAQLAEFSSSLQENDSRLVTELAEKVAGDTRFVDSWFQAGLPLTRDHPEGSEGNRDILLCVAEHCLYLGWKRVSFWRAEAELLDDVSFITEAMKHEPSLFEFASERIRENNFELAMAALSQPVFVTRCEACAAYRRNGGTLFGPSPPCLSVETRDALRIRAENDLRLYNNFVKLFLCGLHFVGQDTIQHQKMSELNGSEGIKRLIGEFVGYPRSQVLRDNMQAALDNLAELWA